MSGGDLSCDLLEPEPFRACDLDDPVQRIGLRRVREGIGEILAGDRLRERRRDRNLIGRANLHHVGDELEMLRRTENREGDAGGADQLLLQLLGAEVVAAEQAIDADDRQHHVMPDTRRASGPRQVASGGLEEALRSGAFVRRRVGDIDHDLGAIQSFAQARPAHGIDTESRRCLQHLQAFLAQVADQPFADAAAAADDDDLHAVVSKEMSCMNGGSSRPSSASARRTAGRSATRAA